MDQKIDWVPSLVFALFGAVFVYASLQVTSFSGGNGPKIVPLTASGLILVLACLQFITDLRTPPSHNEKQPSLFLREFLLYSGPLILFMAAYAQFHIWFGYLISTFLCALAVLKIFKNPWLTSLIHALVATVLLYIVFVRVLGVYDPPGQLIDINEFLF